LGRKPTLARKKSVGSSASIGERLEILNAQERMDNPQSCEYSILTTKPELVATYPIAVSQNYGEKALT